MDRFTITYDWKQIQILPSIYKWRCVIKDNRTGDKFKSEYCETKAEAKAEALQLVSGR